MTWAVDDMLLGMTHIIRGKDLMMETMMERFMWDLWGYKNQPVIIHQGRVRIEGVKTSKSYSRKMIESGEYELGWKDPRTWSTESLRERGFLPESIREFIVYHIGVSENDISIPVETLYTINRRKIDPVSKRIFGMFNPVKIKVENAPGVAVSVNFLPDGSLKKEYFLPEGEHILFVDKDDISDRFRLKDLYNVKKEGERFVFDGFEVRKELPKVQWVIEGDYYDIVLPDGEIKKIFCEHYLKKVNPGETVQLERIGFARFDGTMLWFAHP
jgi:glutamyl-tRNA synthetase